MGPFVGGIVTFVIIVVAILQALAPVFQAISKANEKSKQPPANNFGGGGNTYGNVPADSAFLPELNQKGTQRPAAQVPRPHQNQKSQKNQHAANAQRGQQSRQKQRPPAGNKKTPQKAPSNASSRPTGSGVGAHVESFIGEHVKSHIGKQIGDAVQQNITDQVRSHLGEDKNKQVASAATTHGSAAAGDLLTALRSPQGVRQAILISEVLGKPKALRRS